MGWIILKLKRIQLKKDDHKTKKDELEREGINKGGAEGAHSGAEL